MKQFDVPIIAKTYELYREIHALQRTIPKTDRHSLWVRVQNSALDVLEELLQVGYLSPENRANMLVKISAKVDILRVFLRLTFDVKAINNKKYLHLQEQLDEIGRMLGGWLKSSRSKK